MLYLAVDAGFTDPVAQLIGRFITPGAPESFRLMPLAMDVASGISDERLDRVTREAETALLGDLLNYPMPQLKGALGLDLGDDFRAAPKSAIPTLVLTGTLDGRTCPAEQQAAVAGLRNVTTVTIENAGHNLFMLTPEIVETIGAFFRKDTLSDKTITVDAPSFAPQM
jgi:pimeloyl-ACP methyl ester carboxylesterase